jgi:hypothetical protein
VLDWYAGGSGGGGSGGGERGGGQEGDQGEEEEEDEESDPHSELSADPEDMVETKLLRSMVASIRQEGIEQPIRLLITVRRGGWRLCVLLWVVLGGAGFPVGVGAYLVGGQGRLTHES